MQQPFCLCLCAALIGIQVYRTFAPKVETTKRSQETEKR
jgi:hypothetical protein